MSCELLNCPCCGSGAELTRQPRYAGDRCGDRLIQCASCNLQMPYGEDIDLSKSAAIEAWNTRSPLSDPTPLTLEELRGMDGEPVYIIDDEEPTNNGWVVWTKDHIKYWLDVPGNGECCGTIWRAYTQKQKDREGEG